MQLTPGMILPAVAFLGYCLLVILILIRRGMQINATWMLAGYLGMSVFWTLGVLLSVVQPSALTFRWNKITIYAGASMSITLLLLAQAFLQRWRGALRWLLFGGLGLLAAFLLDPEISRLINIAPLAVGGLVLNQADLANILLAFAWGIFTLATLSLSWQEYRQARSPLHRNRIRYLLLTMTLTIIGDGLYITGNSPCIQISPLIKLGGATAIAYVTFSHHLTDIKQVYRKSISYAILTLITIGIFLLGITLPSTLFHTDQGLSTTLGAALVAIVLAVSYQPLRQATQNLIDQFLFGKSYEYDRVLRNYGRRIADILDLTRLAGVVIDVIDEALDIERGALLISEGGDEGIGKVRLKPYAVRGTISDEIMEFRGSSPLLIHLRLRGLPITQYDLDFQADFEKAHQQERDWLQAMHMDVFVPIQAKARLIGVLAVGAKKSGEPYFSDDLDLLSTLADQTAVALENARLFEDLVMLNSVLSQAYTALGKANRQLQEMDKLKSSFISAITHELRTPFANIDFSLQLLERYAQTNMPPEPTEQLKELAAGIQTARTMIDNLVTLASFFSKQGELRLGWLDFSKMLRDTLLPLKTVAETKELDFNIALPDNLPTIHGDQERLAEAVHHLVQNAIKFTARGGEIWVQCWATADAIYFEVKDNGVGIPADKLDTLWDGFTQMADPLRRGVEGLGLGLALVKYVVSAHDGEVWVNSKEGEGSTFGFHVPLSGPEQQETPDPAQLIRPSSKGYSSKKNHV